MSVLRCAIVALATIITAVGSAAIYVALHDGFGRGDLAAMTTWTLPLAFAVSVVMRTLSSRFPNARKMLAYAMFVSAGAILGFLWTVVAALLLGGWIAAFSFPVLLCWVGGGFAGGVTAALLIHPRSWLAAGLLVALCTIVLVRINIYESAPESAIRIVMKQNANEEEVDSMFTDVLGTRTGRAGHPDEHSLLPSLSTVSVTGRERANPMIFAQFWRHTSLSTRDSVIARILRSPLVIRVDTLPSR